MSQKTKIGTRQQLQKTKTHNDNYKKFKTKKYPKHTNTKPSKPQTSNTITLGDGKPQKTIKIMEAT